VAQGENEFDTPFLEVKIVIRCMCLCAKVFFSGSHTVPLSGHSRGFFSSFFSRLLPSCYAVIFHRPFLAISMLLYLYSSKRQINHHHHHHQLFFKPQKKNIT